MDQPDLFRLPEELMRYQQEHNTRYQWKRLLTRDVDLHLKLDTSHQGQLLEHGWRPVPWSRHPQIAVQSDQILSPYPQSWVSDDLAPYYKDCIVRADEILMERTSEEEARARELENLRAQSQLLDLFERTGIDPETLASRQPSIYSGGTGTAWSCQEWFWFKTWWLLWKVGLPARWLLSKGEREVALRSMHQSGWYRAYTTYAANKAALITEGRL